MTERFSGKSSECAHFSFGEASLANVRSDSRAFIISKGTFLFFAWWKCSGHNSLSTKMARSGSILRHAFRENGSQSKGKGPLAMTRSPYFSLAILSPVLVVPLRMISMEGSESNESRSLAKEESSPTLTACIQIRVLSGFLAWSFGQKPARYLNFTL